MKELIEQYVEALNGLSVSEQRIKLLEMKLDLINQEKYDDIAIIDKRIEELG